MIAPALVVDYDSPTYGTVKIRYCGTLHMPSAYASEHDFEKFMQWHPRKALRGLAILIAHTPPGHEPMKIEGSSLSENCMDVWATCLEDNKAEDSRRIPGVSFSQG